MVDIVEKLRDLAACKHDDLSIAAEAADKIEWLLAEVERLKRSRDRYRKAWKEEQARAALKQEKTDDQA